MLNSPKIPLFYRSPNLNECVIVKYLYNKDNMTYDKTMSRGSLKYFILKKGGAVVIVNGGALVTGATVIFLGGNSRGAIGAKSGGHLSKGAIVAVPFQIFFSYR